LAIVAAFEVCCSILDKPVWQTADSEQHCDQQPRDEEVDRNDGDRRGNDGIGRRPADTLCSTFRTKPYVTTDRSQGRKA
jgi:hypothetical protein